MSKIQLDFKNFRFKSKIEMRWADVDELKHVNNAVYLTYFEQGRIQYFNDVCQWNWKVDGLIVASATIHFVRPLFLHHSPILYLRCAEIGNKSFVLEYLIINEESTNREVIATGNTVMVMFDYESGSSIPVPDHIRAQLNDFEIAKISQKQ